MLRNKSNHIFYCRQKKFSLKNQTFNQCVVQLQSAEISTGNSTTLWSYSKSVVSPLIRTTFSWEIMLIVDTTQWRPWLCSLLLKSGLRIESPFSEEIMSLDKLLRYMGFMMSVSGSMEMPTSGNIIPICLISCHWQRWWRARYSAYMEDYHPT